MVVCPRCGAANRAGSNFCSQCGYAMPQAAAATTDPEGARRPGDSEETAPSAGLERSAETAFPSEMAP